MDLIDALLSQTQEGKIVDVRIGLHWTIAIMEVNGKRCYGLSSTLSSEHPMHGVPDVPQAGLLYEMSGRDLAALAISESRTLASLGVAAINALLPQYPDRWVDKNAEQVILEHGIGKTVALIGHFPFVPRCREQIEKFYVLELRPQEGDLPADTVDRILPQADVVAITGMALANHTLEPLLKLCSPKAKVLVLGPSTPLHPLMYDYGVDMLSGSLVIDPEKVLLTLSQAGNFQQIHRAGVRLVTMAKPEDE